MLCRPLARLSAPAVVTAVLFAQGVALAAPQNCSWSDDFNRPNASTLGPDWSPMNGNFGISSNRGYGIATQHGIAVHATAAATYSDVVNTIDFLPLLQPPPLHYVGLAIGFAPSWASIFVKIQDNNGDGLYDRVFFWSGVNAGNSWNTPSNMDLATPTASGRMKVYFTNNGDTANADIDRDFDGNFDEHFELSGILAANLPLGSELAIVTYGSPAFDNWCAINGTPPPATYCTSSTTSSGCAPVMGASGTPSIAAPSGFTVSCSSVEGQRTGLLFYGASGTVALPWTTGSTSFLCVKSPTQRTLAQSSGGTSGACNGSLSVDLLAFFTANPGALGQPIFAGEQLHAQAWFRDPPAPKTTNLSNGLAITLAP